VTKGLIERFALFTLTDKAEKDDHCANIYHKSLLYLVSNAFEEKPRIPLIRDGEPILGMEKFIRADSALANLFKLPSANWILTPNSAPENSKDSSRASCHGDFDDDKYTLRATLARILEKPLVKADFLIHRSASSLRDRRESLQGKVQR
jgi:hypothetical protein